MRSHKAGRDASQSVAQRLLRGLESPRRRQKNRHVAMHAPFAARLTGAQGCEGGIKIDEPGQSPVPLLHYLMQVDAIVEGREILLRRLAHARDAQGGAQLQFGYANARPPQAGEGGRRLFILQGAVANVVTNADMPAERCGCVSEM